MEKEPCFVVAVDFDNTLFTDAFTEVGTCITGVVNLCKDLKMHRDIRLILWTCRSGKELERAVQACQEVGLYFDAINEDLPEIKEYWKSKGFEGSSKISAKVYIDDSAINPYF